MLGNILGAVVGGAMNLFGQNKANKENRAIANAQMAFQEASQQQQMDFGREMVGRQEDFQKWSIGNQQDFQTSSAAKAMDFAERMSGTSYQRGMADMRAAGLNPILAYAQGGATAPTVAAPSGAGASGASASVSAMPGASARMENILGPAVSSAIQAGMAVTQLEQLAAQVDQTRSATELNNALGQQAQATTALRAAEAVTEGFRPGHIKATTATEWGRPGLVGAQTADTAASAQRRAMENYDYHNWGPPSAVRDPLVTGERAGLRIAPHAGRAVDSARELLGRLWERIR